MNIFSVFVHLGWYSVLLKIVSCDEDSVADACITPNGTLGSCISLRSCPSLAAILAEDPPDPERIKFLQKSTCSLDGSEPKVCCRNDNRPADGRTSASSNAERSTSQIQTINEMAGKSKGTTLPAPGSCGKSQLQCVRNKKPTDKQKAELGDFPWIALLSYQGPTGQKTLSCGGSLINNFFVLTSASCVTDLDDLTISHVTVGEYDLNHEYDCQHGICAPPRQEIPVDSVIHHSGYNLTGRQENDVALIRLKRPAILGPFVQPVCLPREDSTLEPRFPIVTAGWGMRKFSTEYESAVIKQQNVSILPSTRCANMLATGQHLHSSQLCAGGEKGDELCRGADSGGPLMARVFDRNNEEKVVYQLGILSTAPTRCDGSGLAIVTEVSYFIPWINEHMGR